MEKNLPFDASFISTGHSVTQTVQIDDKYKCSSSSPFVGFSRTFLPEEDASTSGDEDFLHSITSSSITSIEASDDDESLSPRSSSGDVASCVYSVMFLLRVHAGYLGHAHASGEGSRLGYRTEPVPEDERADEASSKSFLGCAAETSTRSCKARKKVCKCVSKAHPSAPASERAPKPALPESASDSWVARHHIKSASEDDDAKVIRAVRSILNKLTVEKFESLFHQLIDCGIASPHHISMLMCELFEKATTQHHFIPMYAELCVRLAKNVQIASAANEAGDLHNFRGLLLDQCQQVFEQLLEPGYSENGTDEEDQILRKRRALGNIKLIGELLLRGMLSSSLLVECGNMLLKSRTSCLEALECLAALLVVAGGRFDTKDWPEHAGLEAIFRDMDKLTRDKSVAPRVRFLLRDVLDVRSAGWRTSANLTLLKAPPMKLEEVRHQALEEQAAASPKRQSPQNNQQRLSVVEVASSNHQSPKNLQPRLSVGEACRALLGRSGTHGNDDHEGRNRLPRQNENGPNCRTVSIAGRARLKRQIASDRARVGEKHVRNKAELTEKATPSVSVSPSSVSLCEQEVAQQADMPSTCTAEGFDLVSFRRELAATLTTLACDKNVPAAVQRIRSQRVPIEYQADQFVDILSRIVEERRGGVRRCELAFAAGLMASDCSPFDKNACLDGIRLFFKDVYADMCLEVPRLPAIMRTEFMPMMKGIFSASELNTVLC